MPRKTSRQHPDRPPNFHVGDARVQVVRGPHPDDVNVWYWRAARRSEAGKWESIPGPGWATRERAERQIAQMVGTGEAGAVANHKSREREGGGVITVGDLLEKWLRLGVAPRETAGEIAKAQKNRLFARGLPTEDPSRRRSKAQSLGTSASKPIAKRTADTYRQAAAAIMRSPLIGARILDVSRHPELLEQYRDARQLGNPKTSRAPASPNTVGLELKVISIAWNWGASRGRGYTTGLKLVLPHLEMTPIRDQETPTRETVDAVIEWTPAGSVRTLLYTHGRLGCRIEALDRMLVREVEDDGRGGRARLDAKGHDRIVRLPAGLMDELRPLLRGRDGGERVFAQASRDAYQGAVERALDELNGVYDHIRSVACLKTKCGVGAGADCRGPGGGHNRFHKERKKAAGGAPRRRDHIKRYTSHGVRRRRSQEAREAGIQMHVYMRLFGHTAQEALRAYGQPTVEDEERGWEKVDARAAGKVVPLRRVGE